mgnify:CR=1 FL=1
MAKKQEQHLFETLYNTPIGEHVQKKGGLDFLSWSMAWRMLKQHAPKATFEVHLAPDGTPFFPHGNGGGFVRVSVSTGELVKTTHTCVHPVLDGRNKPIMKPSVFDCNKAVHRALAKACGYHGLGLTLWTGEDLPEVWEEAFEAKLPEGWTLAKVEALCHEKGWPSPAHVTPNRRDTLIEIISKL